MEVQYNVPFYSQHWDLERWQDFGFKDANEARRWQGASCGILCLKMAVETRNGLESIPIAEYVSRGLDVGAYTGKHGWSHGGLVRLAKHFNTFAVAKEHLTLADLNDYLAKGYLPIVSIKFAFENNKTLRERFLFWKMYGGHLALIVGSNERGFVVHHTSTDRFYNWQYREIPFDTFKSTFTGRGVLVSLKRKS